MKLFTIERLTADMIKLLASREDSKNWADHGGKTADLEANIIRNINTVETGYMQHTEDAVRTEQIYKAFRLGMYGVLVDCWKELIVLSKGDYDFMRQWTFLFHIASETAGCPLSNSEPFVQFGTSVNCSEHHYMSGNVKQLEEALNLLRRNFATMTRETNATGTKTRAKSEIIKLLKANPLLQETFLEQALIPSVMERVKKGESAVIRGGLINNIFNLLVTGQSYEAVTKEERFKIVMSELDHIGFFIFDTEKELNEFTQWVEENKNRLQDRIKVVHGDAIDSTKQNVMFISGSAEPVTRSIVEKLLMEVLNYSNLQATGACTDILRSINPEQLKKKESAWDTDKPNTIYQHPEREKQMSANNEELNKAVPKGNAVNDKVPALLEKIITLLSQPKDVSSSRCAYTGRPLQQQPNGLLFGMIQQDDHLKNWVKEVLTQRAVEAYPGVAGNPELRSCVEDLVTGWYDFSASNLADPSQTGNSPQQVIQQPMTQPNPYAHAYVNQRNVATITKVSNTQEIEMSNGTKFVICYDNSGRLTITHVSVKDNHGQLLVDASCSEKDVDYIVASLMEGIEAGHPFKSVQAAVNKLTAPNMMGIQPTYTNY